MRVSTVTDEQVAIITSPKRRRLSPNTSGFAESEDDNDESSPTPYSPVKSRSLGLEPEGASDEDEEAGLGGVMQPSTSGPSCDLDEDDDDMRAAPAVELNVCRACGIALDSFSEYTRHMQQVHNLALQSPPSHKAISKALNESSESPRKSGKGPGRPRKGEDSGDLKLELVRFLFFFMPLKSDEKKILWKPGLRCRGFFRMTLTPTPISMHV